MPQDCLLSEISDFWLVWKEYRTLGWGKNCKHAELSTSGQWMIKWETECIVYIRYCFDEAGSNTTFPSWRGLYFTTSSYFCRNAAGLSWIPVLWLKEPAIPRQVWLSNASRVNPGWEISLESGCWLIIYLMRDCQRQWRDEIRCTRNQ